MAADVAFRTCGVRIDPLSMDEAVTAIITAATEGRPLAVHLVNAYTLALARQDAEVAALLARGDLNLPDGTPLVWVGRRAGIDGFDRRVYGPDLALAVCDRGREDGLRHYLYGSSPDVVDALATSLRARYPGVEIVGVESPPFRPLEAGEEDALVRRVASSGATVMWVGLGTPKQDQFVDRFRDRLGIPLVAVGAAFDFIAGTKRQAPAWMQDRGLEWLYRLAREPRRLWRRYLVGNAVFLAGVMRGVEVVPAATARPGCGEREA